MAVPFILAGVAAVAGLYGVKKGVDAVSDNNEAKDINNLAK